MGSVKEPLRIPLVEDPSIPDTFCTKIGRIDALPGGIFRFVVCVLSIEDGQPVHKQILSLIWHMHDLPDAIQAAAAAMANVPFVAESGKLMPLN